LAPEGLEPHPKLIAAHPGEAANLGRGEDQLHVRLFDGRNPNIDKAVRATCTSDILLDISPLHYEEVQSVNVGIDNQQYFTCAGAPLVSGFSSPGAPKCESISGKKMIVVGVCNDQFSPEPTEARFAVDGLMVSTPDLVGTGGFKRYISNFSTAQFAFPRTGAIVAKNRLLVSNAHVQKTGVGVQ
jgi:hypothetical protein